MSQTTPRRHDPSDHGCRGGVIGDRFDFPSAGVADAPAGEQPSAVAQEDDQDQ